jgi:adenylate kinase
MRIILLGPPGAGKGTQAAKIVNQFHIPHISTGEIFRRIIREGTPLGLAAMEYIDQGLLVPDDLTLEIVNDRLAQGDCAEGFMLDGFPRTVTQATALDEELVTKGISLDKVINIEVRNELLVERITGRRICKNCGENYHISFNPPKIEDKCDVCGGELLHRADDQEETVKKRLEVYTNQTKPLIDHYKTKDINHTIDGEQSIEKVFDDIKKILQGVYKQ